MTEVYVLSVEPMDYDDDRGVIGVYKDSADAQEAAWQWLGDPAHTQLLINNENPDRIQITARIRDMKHLTDTGNLWYRTQDFTAERFTVGAPPKE